MRRFFLTLISWWFALTAPVRTSMKTLTEREYERKRRLLSVLLLVDLAVSLTTTLLESFSLLNMPPVIGWTAVFVFLFTFWLNRRGYLHLAAVICLFCAASLVFAGIQALSLSYPTALLWGLPELMFYLALAGLLLPAWTIGLLAVVEHLVLYWYLFIVRYDELMHFVAPQEFQSFFIYLILWIYFCACIGAMYAITTRKAIIQADRTAEIEQAHHALTEAYATIQKQALTDGLTGLPNHHAVMRQFARELERARRHDRPLSVLFFDADRFKHVNDTYGHAAGDAVLRQIGERAGSVLRGEDTLGRFGGEEFVILLPEVDAREACAIAERIRVAVADGPMATSEAEGGIAMTVSIGLSTYPSDGALEQELLSQADEAMYVAKRLGRNQIRTAQEARRIGEDMDLMMLLQQEGQHEAALREGRTLEQLRESYTSRTIYSLLFLLERRDEGLSAHAHAVSDLATFIAEHIGLDPEEVSRMRIAALLHDIGKVALPDRLLQNPNSLSSHEQTLLREHAEVGAQILEASPLLSNLMPAVRHHHERWDGRGYPDQLVGEAIPLSARIIAAAEAYDGMQQGQPHQAGRSPENALAEVQRGAGTQFDPMVVQALQEVLLSQPSADLRSVKGYAGHDQQLQLQH